MQLNNDFTRALDRVDVGLINRSAIMRELLFNGPLARIEIAEHTSLTGASVSRVTRLLMDAGLLVELNHSPAVSRPGRRMIKLKINSSGGYVVAIGLNTQPEISLVNLANQALATEILHDFPFSDPSAAICQIIDSVEKMISSSGLQRLKILACGIASTGRVDPSAGTIRFAPLWGWNNVPLAQFISEGLGLPVYVEGLSHALNLGEARFGIAKTLKNVLLINVTLRLGASLLLDGRLIRGGDCSAGEISELLLSNDDCTKLNLEGWNLGKSAGGRGILVRCGRNDNERIYANETSSEEAWEMLKHQTNQAMNGNTESQKAFFGAGFALGQNLAPGVALMRPEAIIVSGAAAQVHDYLEGLARALRPKLDSMIPQLHILPSIMTRSAAAGWLAIHDVLIGTGLETRQLHELANLND
jgi:N-acetylglucosamine repressor